MDTICEQLVKIKNGKKFYLGVAGLFVGLLAVTYFSLLFLGIAAPIVITAALYGAYYLLSYLTVEYEYIIVNGSFDIDIIYGKRSRKRLASFELSDVESIDKYKGEELDKNRYQEIIFACNKKSNNAYKFVFSNDSSVSVAVIEPNEKTRTSLLKFVPKYVGNTAFKD